MNTLCGIGIPELILLVLLVFVVVGPDRAKEAALGLGRFLGKTMKSAWFKEISEIAQSLRDLPDTLVRMAELEDVQSELQETLSDIQTQTEFVEGGNSSLRELARSIRTGTFGQSESATETPPEQPVIEETA